MLDDNYGPYIRSEIDDSAALIAKLKTTATLQPLTEFIVMPSPSSDDKNKICWASNSCKQDNQNATTTSPPNTVSQPCTKLRRSTCV